MDNQGSSGEERKEDKAFRLMEKNSSSKLHSKNALRKVSKQLKKSNGVGPGQQISKINTQFEPPTSVIQESFSEANMLNSFDEELHKSLKQGDKFRMKFDEKAE